MNRYQTGPMSRFSYDDPYAWQRSTQEVMSSKEAETAPASSPRPAPRPVQQAPAPAQNRLAAANYAPTPVQENALAFLQPQQGQAYQMPTQGQTVSPAVSDWMQAGVRNAMTSGENTMSMTQPGGYSMAELAQAGLRYGVTGAAAVYGVPDFIIQDAMSRA